MLCSSHSTGAEGVGVVVGRPEFASVEVGEGVGKAVDKGGAALDTGAMRLGAVLDPQARFSTTIAERINIRMDAFMDRCVDGFMVSLSSWRLREFETDVGALQELRRASWTFCSPVCSLKGRRLLKVVHL